MACLLFDPNSDRRGVLSIATSEVAQLLRSNDLNGFVRELRKSYYLLLHHNWHPATSSYSDYFDLHFLETRDCLVPVNSNKLLQLDACNFSPQVFSHKKLEPVWDLLIVGRNVDFKRPQKTIETIREIYDANQELQVLWICPMSMQSENDFRLVEIYTDLFSAREREKFTLLNPSANAPFVLNRRELAHFYLASKVYVHFATYETRCRTAAYAFCSGIPVVGNRVISNILPGELISEPTFFEVKNDDYVTPIMRAMCDSRLTERSRCIEILSEEFTKRRLVDNLNNQLNPEKNFQIEELYGYELDIRLGAAHSGNAGSNSYASNLLEFVAYLMDPGSQTWHDDPIGASTPEAQIDLCRAKSTPGARRKMELISLITKDARRIEVKQSRKGQVAHVLFKLMRMITRKPIIGPLAFNVYQRVKTVFRHKD